MSAEAALTAADLRRLLESGFGSPAVEAVEYKGKTFYVRELGPQDTAAWSDLMMRREERAPDAFKAAMLKLCLSDAAGVPLYQADDATPLALPVVLRNRLFNAAMDVNGIGEAKREALGKPSGETPSSGSSTTSPSSSASALPGSSASASA